MLTVPDVSGLGTFVDKVTLPYSYTDKFRLSDPCADPGIQNVMLLFRFIFNYFISVANVASTLVFLLLLFSLFSLFTNVSSYQIDLSITDLNHTSILSTY